jgi:uncharacterized protein YjiS (DUF1127 family)
LVREQRSGLMQWMANRRLAARTRRELTGLSDVELKDIGITRCSIDAVARGTAGRCGALSESNTCPRIAAGDKVTQRGGSLQPSPRYGGGRIVVKN